MATRSLTHPPPPTAGTAPPPPPDLFVLVKPHSGSHPLNLQVQLLTPSIARGRPVSIASNASSTGTSAAGARSLDAVAGASVSREGSLGGEEGAERTLTRSPSMASSKSGRSGRSRSGSVSGASVSGQSDVESVGSAASGVSGGGGRRRKVTPLLNLSFHTVLPTVVTDAGTDQRVARFHKRGIEFTGLGIFDPVELSSLPSCTPSPFPAPHQPPSSSSSATPTPTPAPSAAPATPTAGLFSKFKKLGFSSSPSSSHSLSSSFSGDSPSKFLSPSSASSSTASDAPLPGALPLIRTPSGPSPTLSPPLDGPPADSRAEGYTFLPRKWLREDLSSSSSSTPRGVEGGLRIEWQRPERRRRSKASVLSGVSGAGGGRRRAGTVTAREGGGGQEVEGRKSTSSRRSTRSNTHDGDGGEDSGVEDSDPEDSDRPWVCTLVIPLPPPSSSSPSELAPPRASLSSARSSSPSPPLSSSHGSPPLSSSSHAPPPPPFPTTRRLHLAHLRPAPHHPKIVSTLLLPPSLPSIPLGSFSPSQGLVGGSLGAEELRDLAMVSALWVAVREGLGGLGGEETVRGEAGRSAMGVKLGVSGVGGGGGGGGKKKEGGKKFGLFGR
ncbi:hypothetical protein JCM8547_003868 [Rhodosporidiobolus lusitaniae]